MSYNPSPDELEPGFLAMADQWSAFIRAWAVELQDASLTGSIDNNDVAERMSLGITDMCADPEEIVAFAMHCILTIAANIRADDLEFP